MKLNRAANAKKGIIYGIVNKFLTLLSQFVVQTVVIRQLGIEYGGLRGLFSSILMMLSLVELGFGSAVVFSMYKPIAEDNIETICALLNFYKKVYRVMGWIILAIGIVIMPFLTSLIDGEYPIEINIYVVFVLFLMNTVFSYWLFAYKSSLLSAYQRTDVSSNIQSVTYVGMSLFQVLVLIITHNFYVYLIIAIIFTIINNIVVSFVVDKMYPEIKCYGSIPKDLLQNIKIKVGGLFIGQLCGTTRNAFDNIFISMFLGLTQAAMYGNYFYVLNALQGISSIVVAPLMGGVGNSIATETKEKNLKDMMQLDFIYLLICGWMAICMLCLYQPFMSLWMGRELMFPMDIVVLFPIYFYLIHMGNMRAVYSDAAGLFWENRTRSIVETIANISLNYFLGKYFGVFGILLATLITVFICAFCWAAFVLFKHYFGKGLREYFLHQFCYAIVTIIVGGITYLACIKLTKMDIGGIVCRGGLCVLIPAILYYITYCKTKIFKESVLWLKRVVSK
ncbi:MAG: hypothetical protein MJ133_01415 [Lachnospiraceae bacterium]|nr:hypothetical protein [Lachnospiraceae bacterium]